MQVCVLARKDAHRENGSLLLTPRWCFVLLKCRASKTQSQTRSSAQNASCTGTCVVASASSMFCSVLASMSSSFSMAIACCRARPPRHEPGLAHTRLCVARSQAPKHNHRARSACTQRERRSRGGLMRHIEMLLPLHRTYVRTETTVNAWGAVGARRVRAPPPCLTLGCKITVVSNLSIVCLF